MAERCCLDKSRFTGIDETVSGIIPLVFLSSKKYLQIQTKASCQTKKNMIIFRQRLVRQIWGGWSDVSSDSGGKGKENGKGSYRLLHRRSDSVSVRHLLSGNSFAWIKLENFPCNEGSSFFRFSRKQDYGQDSAN